MTTRTGAGAAETAPTAGRREARRPHAQEIGRVQLLDAAEELFSRHGFHDTSLREVARLAEFSVGSAYSCFDNKDDLYRQVYLRRGDEFVEGLRHPGRPRPRRPHPRRLIDTRTRLPPG